MKRSVTIVLACIALIVTVAFALSANALWPEAGGTDVRSDSKLTVDCSHMSDGYLMVKGAQNSKKYKVQVTCGKSKLSYDLNNDGEYEVFPLQFGSGKYTITLYVNAGGKKYAAGGKVTVDAKLSREDAAFLVPNQYVNYTPQTTAVALADEICANANTDREKFDAIREYIKNNYQYDFIKATKVTSGTMPDIEYCMSNRMGICQDLSAMVACMLRTQGVPVRFVIGNIGRYYHAWNVVMLEGEEILYDPTAELGGVPNGKYTVERYY